jgi:hypothetical protein
MESSSESAHFWWYSIETAGSLGVHGSRNMESLASCLEERAALYSSVLIDQRIWSVAGIWFVKVSGLLYLGTSRTVQVSQWGGMWPMKAEKAYHDTLKKISPKLMLKLNRAKHFRLPLRSIQLVP